MAKAKETEEKKVTENATEEVAAEVVVETTEATEEKKATKTTKAGKHSAKALKEEAELEAKKVRKAKVVDEDDKPKVKAAPHIKWFSKNYKSAQSEIDRNKSYPLDEALELIQKISKVKFDGSIELHVRLGIDPRQSDQIVRTSTSLPAGTGKTVRVAVIANEKAAAAAKTAGADLVDSEKILADVAKGKFDFDMLIATPDQMANLGKHAKALGPKGLMPSPKSGTVTADPATAIKEIKQGRVELKNDANAIIHTVIGKQSFKHDDLVKNAQTVLEAIMKAKPAAAKGTYVVSVFAAGAMTPSVRIDLSSAVKVK